MTAMDEAELSALIDGELDGARAAELRARIAADPALREQYDALVRLDGAMQALGSANAFAPAVRLPDAVAGKAATASPLAILGLLAGLLLVRLLPKLLDVALAGVALQLAALACITYAVLKMASAPGATARVPLPPRA